MSGLRCHSKSDAQRHLGFTLPDFLIAMSIFTLVITGVLSSHIFGMRMHEVTKTKLGASDKARKAISKMNEEVRTASLIQIGTGNLDSFKEIPVNTPQQGSAIKIFSADKTNEFVHYYFNPTNRTLSRVAGTNPPAVVADSIVNEVIFTSENFEGNVISNHQNNFVIGLNLQFFQQPDKNGRHRVGEIQDSYQLRTKFTKRIF